MKRRKKACPSSSLVVPVNDGEAEGRKSTRRKSLDMQGTDSAKSFLEKLKFGGVPAGAFVDNSAPPDNDGIIVRRIEREYSNEPLSALGIKLSDDAEVLSTEPNSPAAKANVLPHFMITSVNNQFVGSRADFEEIAAQHLTLIIKLQTTGAISELLAKVLDEEEKTDDKNASGRIDFNELLRTTPRFGFLSASHPLFLRWNNRLETQREARQLLRQATREAEEQQAREAFERIRQEMAAEEAKQQQQQQEQQQQQKEVPRPETELSNTLPRREEEFLIKTVQDESAFAQTNEDAATEDSITEDKKAETLDEAQNEASPEELLQLIGVTRKDKVSEIITPNPEEDEQVRFFINPTEEYVLSDGMRVTINVKQRSGPLPRPPPGKPPKGIRALILTHQNTAPKPLNGDSNKICSFCHMRGHTEDRCEEKKEQQRKLALAPKERQICRDYLRGRCTRVDCMMKHISGRGRHSRSPRSRKRSRGRNHRSRERHRRESRRRRHSSRRRGRSYSPDRHYPRR